MFKKIPEIDPVFNNDHLKRISTETHINREKQVYLFAAKLLDENKVNERGNLYLLVIDLSD